MTSETIKSRLDVRPFRPFRVVTSRGVRCPEMAFPPRKGLV